MTDQQLEKLKYPIGKFECPSTITQATIDAWLSILKHLPNRLEQLVANLSDKQLNTVYRPNG